MGRLLSDSLNAFMLAMAPLFGANMLVAAIVEFLQTGFLISFDPLMPQLNKLNPIEGVKKFFSLKQYVELLKSLVKMFVIVYLIYGAIRDEFYMVILVMVIIGKPLLINYQIGFKCI